jgi:hypothetical protein
LAGAGGSQAWRVEKSCRSASQAASARPPPGSVAVAVKGGSACDAGTVDAAADRHHIEFFGGTYSIHFY